MAQIDELLEQAEAQESADSWVLITKYQRKEFYVDSDRAVNIAGRKIEAIKEEVSVQGENHSQYIEFIMDRYYDGIDISEQTLAIHYEVGDASDEDAPINVYKNDMQIKFGWVVENSLTQHATTVEFCIWARGTLADGNAYVLKTLPQKYEIQRGLTIAGGIIEPSNNWYTQFALTMDEKVSQASESADRAVQVASSVDGVVEIVTTARDEVAQKSSTVNTQHSEVESWRQEVEQFRNEAEQFRDEAFATTPDGYAEVVKNVEKNTIKIDTIIEKAELNIKNTASGKNIHLTDSANSKVVEFGLHGKAEQKQYSGKNVVDFLGKSYKVGEFTQVINADGSLTITGTTTATYERARAYNNVPLEPGDYYISGGSKETGKVYYQVEVTHADGTTNYIDNGKFTILDTDTRINLMVQTGNYTGVVNYTIYPMINKGTTQLPFEPYVGGIPSPNPDYPQDITVSGSDGSVEVVSCRKNLLKNTAESATTNGVTFTVNKDGSVSCTGQPTAWTNFKTNNSFILKKGTYKFSSGANFYNPYIRIMRWSDSKDLYNSRKGDIQTIVVEEECECFAQISVSNGYAFTQGTIYPMIRLASDTDDTFEPYTETLSTIPIPNGLCGIKVSSSGNYTDENGQQWICDEIVKYADGSGKRVQRIGKETYEEVTWTDVNAKIYYSDYVYCWCTPRKSIPINYHHPINGNGVNDPIMSNVGTNLYVGQSYLNVETNMTLDEFNTDMSDKALIIYYKLAEPIITDLTAEEIAEIEKLHTFYPVTNISNDADCGMGITYMADAKNYIDNRLAQIESAMLNNI